jgi:hypothetical protein
MAQFKLGCPVVKTHGVFKQRVGVGLSVELGVLAPKPILRYIASRLLGDH